MWLGVGNTWFDRFMDSKLEIHGCTGPRTYGGFIVTMSNIGVSFLTKSQAATSASFLESLYPFIGCS